MSNERTPDLSNPADVALAIAQRRAIPDGAQVNDDVLTELGRLAQAAVDECAPAARRAYAAEATRRLREVDPAVRIAAVADYRTNAAATPAGTIVRPEPVADGVLIVVGEAADQALTTPNGAVVVDGHA